MGAPPSATICAGWLADVLASATQYDLAAVFEQQPVRVWRNRRDSHARAPHPRRCNGALERLLDEAARNGATMALLFSDISHEHQPAGFDVVAMPEAELSVAESSRRGAPMTLIRGGEERDVAATVAMGRIRADPFRSSAGLTADGVARPA